MDGVEHLTAIFNALSPENQAHLLSYARLSRIAENAVKKTAAAGPESAAVKRRKGKHAHTPLSFYEETER
jgi:hypothetical protein